DFAYRSSGSLGLNFLKAYVPNLGRFVLRRSHHSPREKQDRAHHRKNSPKSCCVSEHHHLSPRKSRLFHRLILVTWLNGQAWLRGSNGPCVPLPWTTALPPVIIAKETSAPQSKTRELLFIRLSVFLWIYRPYVRWRTKQQKACHLVQSIRSLPCNRYLLV